MSTRMSATGWCRSRASAGWPACRPPTIDALITLAGQATGNDFWRTGLSLEKMGLAGKSPADLPRFLQEGA